MLVALITFILGVLWSAGELTIVYAEPGPMFYARTRCDSQYLGGGEYGTPRITLTIPPDAPASVWVHELAHAWDCHDDGHSNGSLPYSMPAGEPDPAVWSYCYTNEHEWDACSLVGAAMQAPAGTDPMRLLAGPIEEGWDRGVPWPGGQFVPAPVPGFTATVFHGGGLTALRETAARLNLVSVWATVDGDYVGYIVGAPSFVSDEFLSHFAANDPDGAVFLVVLR